MTTDERFERLEHWTVALAEERRKDREEYKALWRNQEREMDELRAEVRKLGLRIGEFAEESRAADRRLGERIDQLAERSEAADRRLGERIESLVSAIGELARIQANKPQQ